MSEKIYACLLRFFPLRFRRLYGEEALHLFRDRAENEKGFTASLRLWFDLIIDLVVSLPREYCYVEPLFRFPALRQWDGAPIFFVLQQNTPSARALLLGLCLSVFALDMFSMGLAYAGNNRQVNFITGDSGEHESTARGTPQGSLEDEFVVNSDLRVLNRRTFAQASFESHSQSNLFPSGRRYLFSVEGNSQGPSDGWLFIPNRVENLALLPSSMSDPTGKTGETTALDGTFLRQKIAGSEPAPKPAVPAILAAFDNYEVVAMPEAHGMKDVDDFIFSLIRDPLFPDKVNDIAVECGNSLYQPILDRYIAGEDVEFAEVRKVWRNTTQPMCGTSGFFEQFFPLVRAINKQLPPARRLRVLAGDSPVNWDQLTSAEAMKDAPRKFFDRDGSITSVMEKEVLAKHRKALMLFGTFHLMHGASRSAVTSYEKEYPNVTFVISDLLYFNGGSADVPPHPFAAWPVPSLALAKGTWLGALDVSHFFPPLLMFDKDCQVVSGFPKDVQKPMEDLVDGFLYLGPSELALAEQMPADIALDADYMKELRRRETLAGFPGAAGMTEQAQKEEILKGAENPILEMPKPPDTKLITQSCLERKKQSNGIGNTPK